MTLLRSTALASGNGTTCRTPSSVPRPWGVGGCTHLAQVQRPQERDATGVGHSQLSAGGRSPPAGPGWGGSGYSLHLRWTGVSAAQCGLSRQRVRTRGAHAQAVSAAPRRRRTGRTPQRRPGWLTGQATQALHPAPALTSTASPGRIPAAVMQRGAMRAARAPRRRPAPRAGCLGLGPRRLVPSPDFTQGVYAALPWCSCRAPALAPLPPLPLCLRPPAVRCGAKS